METLRQDLQFALRAFLRRPLFTLTAVLTLALGIGANTAIFSVVHGVLLRSLPFRDAEQLVELYTAYPQDETRYPLSPPDFMSYHDQGRVFSDVAAFAQTQQTRTGDGEPTRVDVALVSADFFDLLGVSPVLGRTFRPEENRPDENTTVLLGHAYWQQHFGSDPGVIGRTLTLNGVQRTVVGVLAPGFDYPNDRDLYYPLAYNSTFSSTTAEGRRGEYLGVVARVRPDIPAERVEAEVRALSERLREEFPESNRNVSIEAIPLREELIGDVRTPLLVLLGAVGLVLLIACANVANLLLARATAREGELAVRAALGAGRGRLVRQMLTESVLLGVMGGAAGLLLAWVGTRALIAARPAGIPRLDEIGIDATVMAFTAAASILTGLLFGLVPAVQITRGVLAGSLREGGRGALSGPSGNRMRRGLVVVEMALAVMLLVGAGLLIRSFIELTAVDPGFRAERLITYEVSLPSSSYESGEPVRQFYDRLLERMEALPGVQSVGAAAEVPLTGTGSLLAFQIENREPPPTGVVQDAAVTPATPGYFPTLGVPLRRGRLIGEQDRAGSPEVMLVNEAFVRRYFPAEDPLGQRVTLDGEEWIEVVGVVGDVPQYGLDKEVRPAVFVPYAQFSTRSMTIAARSTADPMALSRAIRAELAALDPDLPLEQFTTGEQLLDEVVAQPRFYTMLLVIFAAVALVLAAGGIFGVMSYVVAQRTREIGIRMALGADPGSVRGLVLRGALGLALVGLGAGLFAAFAGARLLSGLLYGVSATDPLTYAGVAVVLFGAAWLASYLPARSATRVDPMVALRAE